MFWLSAPQIQRSMRMFSFPSNMLFIISGYPDQCEVVVRGSPPCWKSGKTTMELPLLRHMASWRPHTLLKGFFVIDTLETYAVETFEVPPPTQTLYNEQD